MFRTRVKICGIRRLEDAQAAVNAGADALGFVFYEKSPRSVSPEQAADIIAQLPAFVTSVGLFVETANTPNLRCLRWANRALFLFVDSCCVPFSFCPNKKGFQLRKPIARSPFYN